ncbi:hypothetical protein CAPTEDRAFT_187327 [Capitella teleta]|uniref:Uncharacterized protein n=1 Tax=Capitella teleta TaxID=283909 RepID=X1ZK54_CAPTE|nr:hypothetical protein CAPTEDRAFT_187327 [Capitella teleta]|eukprot:ELU10158.1 hypothetical protein CAPTEDRAFT_187327 [Capitella teleta]
MELGRQHNYAMWCYFVAIVIKGLLCEQTPDYTNNRQDLQGLPTVVKRERRVSGTLQKSSKPFDHVPVYSDERKAHSLLVSSHKYSALVIDLVLQLFLDNIHNRRIVSKLNSIIFIKAPRVDQKRLDNTIKVGYHCIYPRGSQGHCKFHALYVLEMVQSYCPSELGLLRQPTLATFVCNASKNAKPKTAEKTRIVFGIVHDWAHICLQTHICLHQNESEQTRWNRVNPLNRGTALHVLGHYIRLMGMRSPILIATSIQSASHQDYSE